VALSRKLAPVLVVNAGSTSLKRSLVDAEERSTPVEGYVPAAAVGHRVVHGGTRFLGPVLADDAAVAAVAELSSLAPLHDAPALAALADARAALPDVPHVLVFDTAFHAGIPAEAATYAVPRRWREEWGVRRYGFHGLAVEWAAERVPVPRLVVCHLGGGCSVTAVRDGRSVDTTMGFSPLEGVPMATRSGSVDPGALLHLLRERGLSPERLERALQHESGLAALGGLDDPLGFAVYTYRIAQAVAAMAVALGGVDALAFSGGVGENRGDVRDAVVARLGFLGPPRVEVVHAREDVVVARAVRRLLENPQIAAAPH
jgi:acetate kinase